MAWVRFNADYDYRLPSSTIAYKKGMTQNVTNACATLAVAAGKAVRLNKAGKNYEPIVVEMNLGDPALPAPPTEYGEFRFSTVFTEVPDGGKA